MTLPLLLGYIRADLLGSRAELHRMEAQLHECAEREDFCLGTVFVEQGRNPGAFHALMAEASRDEAWGIVVPDLRHVGVVEQLILNSHEAGARLTGPRVPRPGGPGADRPARQVRRSTRVSPSPPS